MRAVLPLLLLAAACGGDDNPSDDGPDHDAPVAIDAAAGPDANLDEPGTLAETGLCVDAACTQIAATAREFAPEFPLWSDDAAKRRWIYLPDGAQIDTSDMDYWEFPVGTKLWKEFNRDDVRVETRLLQRNADRWYMVAFAWNEAQDAAVAVPLGEDDWLGTEHDIPSHSDCRKCHDNTPNRVLGFQAILLDHDAAGVTLADLVEEGRLTDPPTPQAGGRFFPLPGDATAQAALGYLHTNCGNCHNPVSQVHNTVPLEWRLTVGTLGDLATTPPYLTAVDVAPTLTNVPAATAIIEPGAPEASSAFLRMQSTQSATMMPPNGRELVDDTGSAAVEAWIEAL